MQGTASFGTASFIKGGFSNIATMNGPLDGGTLTGENLPSTWTLNDAPTYSDGTHTLAFQNFQTLQAGNGGDTFEIEASTTADLLGGAGDDVFSFYGTAVLTGNIDGGAGTNTLSYYDGTSGYTSGLTITLSGVSTNGYAGTESSSFASGHTFTNISNLIGNSASNTAQVDGIPSDAATWTVNGNGLAGMSYQDTATGGNPTLGISGVTDLKGGTGNNTFNITANTTVNLDGNTTSGTNTNQFVFFNTTAGTAVLTGNITGGTGASTNTLSYYDSTSDSGYASALKIVLTGVSPYGYTGTESSSIASGSFTNISNLIGNSPSSYTTQVDGIGSVAATWTVGGASAMSYQDTTGSHPTLGISGVTDLVGGTGDNTFNITGSTTVNLHGNAHRHRHEPVRLLQHRGADRQHRRRHRHRHPHAQLLGLGGGRFKARDRAERTVRQGLYWDRIEQLCLVGKRLYQHLAIDRVHSVRLFNPG